MTQEPPRPPAPKIEDFATNEAFSSAWASYIAENNPGGTQSHVAYQLRFEADGSFRIEDVPAGAYELRIRVTEPRAKGEQFDFNKKPVEIASLMREVIVPRIPGDRSDSPLDLGTLNLEWKRPAVAKPRLLAQLQAQTLDGQPLALDQFKGRNVLLVFWTSWSERSMEQLAGLAKLREELGADAALTFVGVSLDEDAATALKAVEARGYRWTQGWLDAKGRGQTAAAFDVKSLPAVFLLDKEGCVVARDLEGERLPVAVRRQLAKK